MKKLLVLLLLLVLFLYSCSTADGGETSGTPDTTAPEITTEETTDEITTDGGEEEPAKFEGFDGFWPLPWTPYAPSPTLSELYAERDALVLNATPEERALTLKTPCSVVYYVNGFTVDVFFFLETYRFADVMPVRVTVTNRRTETVSLTESPRESMKLQKDDDALLPLGWISIDDQILVEESETEGYMSPIELSTGESYTFERVFFLDLSEVRPDTFTFSVLLDGEETALAAIPLETAVGEVEEIAVVPREEIPWYLEEWETAKPYEPLPVPEEKADLALRVPLVSEQNVDGIYSKVEFFREYYPLGEGMQVRISLTNGTGEDLSLLVSTQGLGRIRTSLPNMMLRPFSRLDYLPYEHEKDYYTQEFYYSLEPYYVTIPAGETLTLEYLYTLSPTFFRASSTYTFDVYIQQPSVYRQFSIPIELVPVVWETDAAEP